MKPGRKTLEWDQERARLKIEFEQMGVTECELRYPGTCWHDYALGFAHSKKRRFLKRHELKHVILCCNPCHNILESLPHDLMEVEVDQVIRNRKKYFKKNVDLRKQLMQLSGRA